MKKNLKIGELTETACFECGGGDLVRDDVSLTGNRYGESFVIRMPGLRCTKCGFATIDSIASAEFTRLVSDAYREKHGLLIGSELRARREQLRMSQQQFADYLGVGVASVKRWELGQVQDKAMDELIRLKTDPEAARNNLKALELKVPEQCILSSAIVDGQEVELSFTLDQKEYGSKPRIKMDWSDLLPIEGEKTSIAA
jgi:putative zinc finger/helix-turn-helix YgiT family protein